MHRQSLKTLPGRSFSEPEFSAASIIFAEAVAEELIQAADRARPLWAELATVYPDDIERLHSEKAFEQRDVFRLPLVEQFASLWVDSMRWPAVCAYRDGFQLQVPDSIIEPLRKSSSVQNVEMYLAAIPEVCCARLGSNDHDCNYGLYINTPIWIPLAIVPTFKASFDRQVRMVVYHETGHFRWRSNGLRAELVAHARGVAGLKKERWPSDDAALIDLLKAEHPEAWSNREIQTLVSETAGGVRLIRIWADKMSRYSNRGK